VRFRKSDFQNSPHFKPPRLAARATPPKEGNLECVSTHSASPFGEGGLPQAVDGEGVENAARWPLHSGSARPRFSESSRGIQKKRFSKLPVLQTTPSRCASHPSEGGEFGVRVRAFIRRTVEDDGRVSRRLFMDLRFPKSSPKPPRLAARATPPREGNLECVSTHSASPFGEGGPPQAVEGGRGVF